MRRKGRSAVSRVKQWPVYTFNGGRRRVPERPRRGPEPGRDSGPGPDLEERTPPPGRRPPGPRERDGRRQEVRGVRTTGIFQVPSDTVIQLVVAVSSFSDQEQPASVRVRKVSGNQLEPVFFRALTIPAGGAERVVVDGLAGERVEVEVTLPSDQLVPTVTVTQYFPADGGILVLVYKAPGDLVAV